MTAGLYSRIYEVAVTKDAMTVRGFVDPPPADDTLERVYLKHRRAGMVRMLHVTESRAVGPGLIFAASLELDNAESILTGVWDLWIESADPEGSWRPRYAPTQEDEAVNALSEQLRLRPYATRTDEFSVAVEPRESVTLEEVWLTESRFSLVGGLDDQERDIEGLVALGDSFAVLGSVTRDGARIEGRLALPELPIGRTTGDPWTIHWLVRSHETRRHLEPVTGRPHPTARAEDVWALPSRAVRTASGVRHCSARFDRAGRLALAFDSPFRAVIEGVDASAWKAGTLRLDVRLEANGYPASALPAVSEAALTVNAGDIAHESYRLPDVDVPSRFSVSVQPRFSYERREHYRFGLQLSCAVWEGTIPLLASTDRLVGKWNCFLDGATRARSGYHRSFYFGGAAVQLCVECRPLKYRERRRTKVKDAAAKVAASLAKPFLERQTWLVGENMGRKAQDNGFAFFRYCVEKQVPENVLFVARNDSADLERLAPYEGRVVRYNSFSHFFWYHVADRILVAHGVRDVAPATHHAVNENTKPVVYLQHGITAMKKIFYNDRSYGGQIEKFIVSSETEKSFMRDVNRMSESRLAVTGFPRHDWLCNELSSTPTILVMPTWREWVSKKHFETSDFFSQYSSLLQSQDLGGLLEAHDARLVFAPHPSVEEHFTGLQGVLGSRIEIAGTDGRTLQDHIRQSRVLITDYSSIAWEFVYLGKPVVFFHFDRSEYLARRGSYIDLERDLPGPVALHPDAVIQRLSEALERPIEETSADRRSPFFDFSDRGNCARVYGAIHGGRRGAP